MTDSIENNLQDTTPEVTIDPPVEVIPEETRENRIRSTFTEFLNAFRTETLTPAIEKLGAKLSKEWEILDASWSEKYGDRYQQLKQYLEIAKTRYDEEKLKLDGGEPTIVETTQSEWDSRFAGAGTFAARAEERIKQRLVELWENRKIKA
ncbi:hypothetical protein V0288_12980 [Pannus brasiliensis CCIBt3594]|uniref:HMG box domain-containing protein n=1 Tax=Pannus brasiliensis CCIBt3594 TaxID=1427578 RepID=A0AAW9QSK9_9CHRO